MNWAKDAFHTGYQFNPRANNYDSQIKQIASYSNMQEIWPELREVELQNKPNDPLDTTTLKVVTFNFTVMLHTLLHDMNINQEENLVVNEKDWFAKYESPNGKLGEVNNRSWYNNAYNTMVKDVNKDFLLPIIFAMDKTTISSTARMSVYAVMFTTTIFNCTTRNKLQAWRPLGYIPIEKNFYSSAQWSRMGKDLKAKRENQLYATVLESF